MQSEWRGAQVENDFGALLDQTAGRLAIVERAGKVMFGPNVLANRDTDFRPTTIERLDFVRRLKITVFVKDVISRQKLFVCDADRLALFQ